MEDLQPGTRVMVTGEKEDDGSITASRIAILAGDAVPGGPENPPLETAP